MVGPFDNVGEDVPPNLTPETRLLLGLIRDTIMTPKPIGRDQAALAILCAIIPTMPLKSGQVPSQVYSAIIHVSINAADLLLELLAQPPEAE